MLKFKALIFIFCTLLLSQALSGCGDKSGKSSEKTENEQIDQTAKESDGNPKNLEKPVFLFKNVPSAGLDVSGVFKLKVEAKNFPADVIWSAGASPRKNSTTSEDVGFVVFDKKIDEKEANIDTFLVEKNSGAYYLFAVIIYPNGATETIFSDGALRVNNTGVPRIENPLFFADALGAGRNRENLGTINSQECCVFLQDSADADGKQIVFDVPISNDAFQYSLDLLNGSSVLPANVVGDFTTEDDAENELRHVRVQWKPAGLTKDVNYRLRLTVVNTVSQKNTVLESPVFGIYGTDETPQYDDLIATGGPLQACSTCHTTEMNREFIWNNYQSFATWDVRSDNSGIFHRALLRTSMQPGYMPQNSSLSADHKIALELFMKSGSPAPPAP